MQRSWPLKFNVVKKCSKTKARASILVLPHGNVTTPVFMPVGTHAAVKGLLPDDLYDIGFEIILGNTYHLGTRPGIEIMEKSGNLHTFMNWNRNILTDSGGFQMVSLSKLSSVTERGVTFSHPVDGSLCHLSPEKSIEIQMALGSDIMMQLDDVVSSTTTGPRVEEAMQRSIRWLDRCLSTIPTCQTKQNLFPIIQGGLDEKLRKICLDEMTQRDVPGFAIGGLSGGEAKDDFCRIVSLCTDHLPTEKPRYLMGVGYAQDLVVCTALGCDMFDCVFPTRTARFGYALTRRGSINLKSLQQSEDFNPIDSKCSCKTCSDYTRAHLHYLFSNDSVLGPQLLTLHNLSFQVCYTIMLKTLMDDMRKSIIDNGFPEWIQNFFHDLDNIQDWVKKGLKLANIEIE